MRRTFVVATLSTLLITASAVCAPPIVSKNSSKASATRAVSAAEQLALAARLSAEMERTPPPQKLDLFAQAWSNLSLVRSAWPNDKNAVVQSGVMQADLATEFSAWQKVVDVLVEILPSAANTDSEPHVEQKLGQAYEQVGNAAESERHLLAAERAMHRTHLNRVESEEILSRLAMFYSRQNKPQEAMKRFREAQNLPGQDVVNKMRFQLSLIEQADRVGKNVAAPEFLRFDDLISESQRTALSPSDATLVSHMKQHAQRVHDAETKGK